MQLGKKSVVLTPGSAFDNTGLSKAAWAFYVFNFSPLCVRKHTIISNTFFSVLIDLSRTTAASDFGGTMP